MKDYCLVVIGAMLAVICPWVNSKYKILDKILIWLKKIVYGKHPVRSLSKEEKNCIKDNKDYFMSEYCCFLDSLYAFCEIYNSNEESKFNTIFTILYTFVKKEIITPNLDTDLLDCFEIFKYKRIQLEKDEKIIFKKLESKYDHLIEKLKAKIMDTNNEYIDVNDKKLKKDINKYEPYLHYWDNSDKYIIDIIKHKMFLLRKNNSSAYLKILDIGGGNGRLIYELAQSTDCIVFVEPDFKRMEEAKNKLSSYTNVEYVSQKFERIEWSQMKNRKFDIIICSHVIQHVSTEKYERIIRGLNPLLKSRGFLFLMCPLSFTKYNEYVVHGLEYDVWRIDKQEIDNSDARINEILQTRNMCMLNDDNPTAYVEDYIVYCEKNITYSLQKKKDCYLLYKRIYDEGLVYSLPRNIVIEVDKIRKQLNGIIKLDESYTLQLTCYSRQWLIGNSDQQKINDYQIAIKIDNYTVNTYIIKKAIINHVYYTLQIKNEKIPSEFSDALKVKAARLKIEQNDQENRWLIVDNKTTETIAWIVKTQNYYLLINDLEVKNKFTYDKFKKLYTNPELLGKNIIIYDSEFSEGFLISEKGVYTHYLRFDNDWLRLFKKTDISDKEIEHILKSKVTSWQNNLIDIDTDRKNYIWTIKRNKDDKSFEKLLPQYCVMQVNEYNTSEKYFIYRDKRYTRLSQYAFNKLCKEELLKYKILPTHHFVKYNLIQHLKMYGLKQASFKSYHLGCKKYFLDNFLLRDKLFNFLKLNNIRYFRELVKARDCLIIIKKNER